MEALDSGTFMHSLECDFRLWRKIDVWRSLESTKEARMEKADDGYILFDVPEGVEPTDRSFLEQLGHPVAVCHGPAPDQLCPILSDEGCPLASGAHGIVFELDLDRPQHQAILAKYRESLRSDMPIRVAIRPDQRERNSDLLRGLKVWSHEPVAGDLDGLAAEVEATEL